MSSQSQDVFSPASKHRMTHRCRFCDLGSKIFWDTAKDHWTHFQLWGFEKCRNTFLWNECPNCIEHEPLRFINGVWVHKFGTVCPTRNEDTGIPTESKSPAVTPLASPTKGDSSPPTIVIPDSPPKASWPSQSTATTTSTADAPTVPNSPIRSRNGSVTARTQNRLQRFVFTLNNYSEGEVAWLKNVTDWPKQPKWLIFGKEICPTTGTPHLQGRIILFLDSLILVLLLLLIFTY